MNDLKDLKVSDIIRSEAFAKELRQQLDIEEAVQTKMIASGITRRTTLDRLRERGVWNERDMAVLWPRVMDKTLEGYSAAERRAIGAVCMAAYNRTMKKAVAEEKSEKGGEG